MNVVFMTRFSYLGAGGWRSKASKKSELLFQAERMEKRFKLFESITLPSLMSQTDMNFDWIVLSSNMMPEAFADRLQKTVSKLPNKGQSKVLFRGPRHVAGVFRRSIQRIYDADGLVSSVVLDDDDAVSDNFVEVCREQATYAWGARDQSKDYVITSFPRGYSLILSKGEEAKLSTRNVPFTNLGLTLTAPAKCKRNLFSMSHKKIEERHPNYTFDNGIPYYVRAVHSTNDSRAILPPTAQPVGFEEAQEHFSGLDTEPFSRS